MTGNATEEIADAVEMLIDVPAVIVLVGAVVTLKLLMVGTGFAATVYVVLPILTFEADVRANENDGLTVNAVIPEATSAATVIGVPALIAHSYTLGPVTLLASNPKAFATVDADDVHDIYIADKSVAVESAGL
jgi:hypothetical protein